MYILFLYDRAFSFTKVLFFHVHFGLKKNVLMFNSTCKFVTASK